MCQEHPCGLRPNTYSYRYGYNVTGDALWPQVAHCRLLSQFTLDRNCLLCIVYLQPVGESQPGDTTTSYPSLEPVS
jgi:hypothetical protein